MGPQNHLFQKEKNPKPPGLCWFHVHSQGQCSSTMLLHSPPSRSCLGVSNNSKKNQVMVEPPVSTCTKVLWFQPPKEGRVSEYPHPRAGKTVRLWRIIFYKSICSHFHRLPVTTDRFVFFWGGITDLQSYRQETLPWYLWVYRNHLEDIPKKLHIQR